MGFMAVVNDDGISWIVRSGDLGNKFQLPDARMCKKLLAEGLGTSALIAGKIFENEHPCKMPLFAGKRLRRFCS